MTDSQETAYDDESAEVRIYYCPFCGRELAEGVVRNEYS